MPSPAVKKDPMPLRRKKNGTTNVASEKTRMRMARRLPHPMWYWSMVCTRRLARMAQATKLYRTVRRT